MTKLTRGDVRHVADLAKLKLTEKETTKFLQQLSKIIDYVSELQEVDTSGTDPTSQTTGLTDVVSKDDIDTARCLTVSEALSGTEKTHNDFFVVPAILEK